LHLLGYNSHQGDLIKASLLGLILSHGPGFISHTDKGGKTALHVFAQNLRQAAGTRFLIEQGANIRARSLRRETPFHTAAWGILNPHVRGPGRDDNVTCANKIKLQDEMMHILQEAAREDTAVLMSQPNAEGKTPQDLLKETRDRWRHMEQSRIGGGRGRGRGRGLPVGA
jgi:ankyrin repeat protein